MQRARLDRAVAAVEDVCVCAILQDVIYHLETYDVTTIRAGTPMFILSRKIKAMGTKPGSSVWKHR